MVKRHLFVEKEKQDEYREAMGAGYHNNGYVCKWKNGRPFKVSYLTTH
jgi:hypothetical protein